ncbi:unnamed protein product [Ectocarpus fasciculatus]
MSSVAFDTQKETILSNLQAGIDFSPKGCIDAPIVDLVDCINSLPDYCTTSSCSGRISCYRVLAERKGIDWILVRHAEVDALSVVNCVKNTCRQTGDTVQPEDQLTMLKCEGVLLHILARDVEAARTLHSIAMATGFRECGISIGPKKVILAIRTTAFGLELPIAAGDEMLLRDRAIQLTVEEANKRLRCNFARIDRLLSAIKDYFKWPILRQLPIQGDGLTSEVVNRWGHVAVPCGNDQLSMLGGFGLAECRSSRKTTSAVVSVSSKGSTFTFHLSPEDSFSAEPIELMHSAADTDGDVLVVVGGRTSPKFASDVVMFLDKKTLMPREDHGMTPGSLTPGGRWGHSFTYIGHSCFLLVGGRDCDCVLDEAFVLKKVSSASAAGADGFTHEWKWYTVSLSQPIVDVISFGRFFHANCALDGDISGHNHRLFPGENAEAVDREPTSADDGFMVFSRVEADALSDDRGKSTEARCAPKPIDEQALLAFDWLSGEDGKIFLVRRSIVVQPLQDLRTETNVCGPHSLCRSHHQSALLACGENILNRQNVLVMTGGGTLCVGFSPHYCSPLAFELSWGYGETINPVNTAENKVETLSNSSSLSVMKQNQLSWVLLAPKLAVKQIKNVLEKSNLIIKSRRISTFRADGPDTELLAYLNDIVAALSKLLPADLSGKLFLARQQNPAAKLDIVSGHRRAEENLLALCKTYNIDPQEIPKKFEMVGDILMIQEHCLLSPKWYQSFNNELHFWSTLAAWFGLKRIARKARVDPGPKRESHVELLYVSPDFHSTKKTGKRKLCRNEKTDGWVVVSENNISFGFDITRVMFCSGNNTERMRMGRVQAENQVVVDLYSGIGYYTMPFLVHTKAAIVHAFEWNINSVASLIVNLSMAGVSKDRCVLHYGDNNLAVFEKWATELTDVADRVSLGLLPCSRGGWEAAVRVLRRKGGVLHVHYNVNTVDIPGWVVDMCATFTQLFAEGGKPMKLECTHVEKVKTYAPRVHHIVADVTCTPLVG